MGVPLTMRCAVPPTGPNTITSYFARRSAMSLSFWSEM